MSTPERAGLVLIGGVLGATVGALLAFLVSLVE